MSYEYKAVIMMNLRDFDAGRTARHGTYDLEGKLAELERVYAEAAKAEECEAKAKAWDRTQELLEECTHQTPGDDYEVDWHEFEMKIDDIIEKYESGESE